MQSQLSQTPLLQTLAHQSTSRTPVWLMRQAGRYMPQYRDIRSKVSFLDLCKDSDLACEVTVFAVNELGVDAGIIFADILLPLEPMGVGLAFVKGDGPVIERPLRSVEDIDRLPDFDVSGELHYVLTAIEKVVKEFAGKTPLIGFAGAPFTLASYAIEGGASRNYERTKRLMYCEPHAWARLMEYLCDFTTRYLNCQIKAGADVVQIFDSWVGCLSPADYETYILPHMQKLISGVKGAPLIYFGTSTGGLLELFSRVGATAIGVDWRVDLYKAWQKIGFETVIQGNLDPVVLLSTKEEIQKQARNILNRAGGRRGHIFNLGHGILPDTPVENVKYLVEVVHQFVPVVG